MSQKVSLEVLKKDLHLAEEKTASMDQNLDDLISKCAFTYTSIENPKIRLEMIINGTDGVTKEIKDSISLNCHL